MRKNIIVTLVVTVLTLWTTPGLTADIHVPAGQPTIQAAIDAAVDGDQVLVASGTYVENINFGGKAITVQGVEGSYVTAIDGNQNGAVVTFSSGEGELSVLSGFRVKNGNNSDTYGGGIYCYGSSPMISNCDVAENVAYYGGGIGCTASSSPTIVDCDVYFNQAIWDGGGVYCQDDSNPLVMDSYISMNDAIWDGGGVAFGYCSPIFVETDISENNAPHGAGVWCHHSTSFSFIDCDFSENQATGNGGAFHIDSSGPGCIILDSSIQDNFAERGAGVYLHSSSPTLFMSSITNNVASTKGGGIDCSGGSSPVVERCIIGHNQANFGGGIASNASSPVLINSVIGGNTATSLGGGIYGIGSSSMSLTHCTIADNTTERGGGVYCSDGSSADLVNCILWADSAEQGPEISVGPGVSTVSVSYCDVQGGEAQVSVDASSTLNWGEGNIDADPLFAGYSYYGIVEPSSPVIDVGTDAGIYTDMDGNPRPLGDGFDIGADEYEEPYMYTLYLDATYSEGYLHMNFVVGALMPVYWVNYLIVLTPTIQVIPLWVAPLPVINPPMVIPVSLPCPDLGPMGVFSGLYSADGPEISGIDWIGVGPWSL